KVISLTTDKSAVTKAIGGIWTNNVKGFSTGSRCWDALLAAVKELSGTNRDEQKFVVFVSDGRDESSVATVTNVINAATNAHVAVYCVGFGPELDATTLQNLTDATSGRYYEATNLKELSEGFSQISKDVNGQFILRWATLKRTAKAFMPSFEIS